MKPIELYDIITLENKEEYTVIKIHIENDKKYFLLASVDEDEEPDMENIKIVEEIKKNDGILIQEIEDQETLKRMSKIFLSSLREGLE